MHHTYVGDIAARRRFAIRSKQAISRRGSIRGGVLFALSLSLIVVGELHADDKIKAGVLKFGTVNWELDTIKHHGLDKKHGVDLEVVKYGGGGATKVALQGKAVDLIVSDWIWVTRQRAEGKLYTFAPYSLAVGALVVHPDANIASVPDLEGKRVGIAGGPVDKSWLLLRAYTKKKYGTDIADMIEAEFGAPPLMNKLIMNGDLDAVVNFWHFGARLQAAGMVPLIEVKDILPELGVDGEIPLLGWVFDEAWGNEHADKLAGFLRASYEAKALLLESDEEWERLRELTKAKDDATFTALRETWRAGVPKAFGKAEQERASQAFDIMVAVGGSELAGKATSLVPGTFWDRVDLSPIVE